MPLHLHHISLSAATSLHPTSQSQLHCSRLLLGSKHKLSSWSWSKLGWKLTGYSPPWNRPTSTSTDLASPQLPGFHLFRKMMMTIGMTSMMAMIRSRESLGEESSSSLVRRGSVRVRRSQEKADGGTLRRCSPMCWLPLWWLRLVRRGGRYWKSKD